MKNLSYIMTFLVLIVLVLSACTPLARISDGVDSPTPEPVHQLTIREAQVQSVEIQTINTNPMQVNAIVRGNLAESCATLGESQVKYDSNTIRIAVYAVSRSDIGCAQVTTSFETTITLDINKMTAGTYTAIANGASAVFTLPAPDQALGSINGWVWHDVCANGSANPGVNCVQAGNSYRGDGLMENDEPPIGGVKVTLGMGACPSTGLKETATIATDLSYSFVGLEAGIYCVSIDPQTETNSGILLPGSWTYPSLADGTVGSTVTLGAGENKFDVNFGWDYQFLPPVSQACTDSAKFVSDVTIPDNSVITSNSAFTKIWRLKNTGTCTWDNNYLVAFVSGTTMSQQPGYWIVPQGQTVAPGQTVDVSVGMTAPVDNGNYASYWGMKKVDGQFMPIQGGANGNSFYVKIKVNNGVVEGKITAQSIGIELEQGSGAVCTANATYFAHASITADGATTATYEVGSTAGQIPAGYFYTSPTGPVSVYVTGAVVFDQASTKTIDFRFVGPYPYPDDITISLRVNGGEWYNTKLSCQ
jgi:hypothetical protein